MKNDAGAKKSPHPDVDKKVMAFGTFDFFHKGHEKFLSQAAKFGSYLLVVVARDRNVRKIKGRQPCFSERERKDAVRKSRLADKVVLGGLVDRYAVIKKFKPSVICLGYDQKVNILELRKNLLEFDLGDVTIKRLKAYKPAIYKSSKLKKTNKKNCR